MTAPSGTFGSSPAVAHAAATGTTIVTGGGTFQQALAANPARKGGYIQNNSVAAVMYIFLGATADATDAKSTQVPAGKFFNLNLGLPGFIYQGAVQIDGTAADGFSIVEVT